MVLVIANVALTGVDGPAFITLRELATVSAEEGGRIRALFLVPEAERRPVHRPARNRAPPLCNSALSPSRFPRKSQRPPRRGESDRCSSPPGPPRFGALRKKKEASGSLQFHVRLRESFSYTEEEIAEFERQEGEASKSRRNKPRTNLGDPNR